MSQPRQIMHLISALDGYGESRQLRLLIEPQLADGNLVRIVALSANQQVRRKFEQAGATCHVLRQRWKYDPIAAWRLARELREQPHDLLHVWGLHALRYADFVRPDSTKAPWVATLVKLPRRHFDLAADCFVIPHPQDRNTEGAIVIPPGVALPESQPLPRTEFLKQFALPAESSVIAVGGLLTRSRAIDDAIWCFELVRTLDERARLLIFGDGPDRHRLERFARLASEASAIRFLGYRDDLHCWLPHVAVFWQPGGEEPAAGLPLAALEVMVSSVPVVASDVPAHREVIDEGRTGYLYPIGSRAICARHTVRLLQDEEHASAIAQSAAKDISRRFSLAAFSRAYAELYQRLLARGR